MPELIRVIRSKESKGRGLKCDPCRTVVVYHSTEGDRLAEDDPCSPPVRLCGCARDPVNLSLSQEQQERTVERCESCKGRGWVWS